MLRSLIAAFVAALLAVPAAAAAAPTEIGQTAASDACSGDLLVWQTSASHKAPAKGVLTQLRTSSGTAGALVSIKVIRPSTPEVIYTTGPLTVPAPGQVVSVDVRVPVNQGDTLGLWLDSLGICLSPGSTSDTIAGVTGPDDPPVGPIGEITAAGDKFRLAVAARFELDADGDGYGDDTQDGCPTDPAVFLGPCSADADLSATVTPASIEVGDVAVIAVNAASGSKALGARLAASLPPGLESVLVSPRSCAFATALSCALGDLEAGAREVALVVRGAAAGSYTVPISLVATTSDPNPANNAASVGIHVTPAAARACKVPKLKGRTKAFAGALLRAAGCRLGATKTKRQRKGKARRVIAQSVRAGADVPLGTHVNVTLRRRGPR